MPAPAAQHTSLFAGRIEFTATPSYHVSRPRLPHSLTPTRHPRPCLLLVTASLLSCFISVNTTQSTTRITAITTNTNHSKWACPLYGPASPQPYNTRLFLQLLTGQRHARAHTHAHTRTHAPSRLSHPIRSPCTGDAGGRSGMRVPQGESPAQGRLKVTVPLIKL